MLRMIVILQGNEAEKRFYVPTSAVFSSKIHSFAQ